VLATKSDILREGQHEATFVDAAKQFCNRVLTRLAPGSMLRRNNDAMQQAPRQHATTGATQEFGMENKFFAQWESYTKSAIASGKELEAISSKVLDQLVEKQLDLVNGAVDTSSKFFSAISQAKDYQDLIAEQTKLVSVYGEKLLTAAKQATEILTASRDEYLAWFEKGMKSVYDQTQSVVSSTGLAAAA
jgi:phasin family protein